MRFEVPQFIDVEDKIFGPLTWKQFIYIAGGAGAGVVGFLLLPFLFFIIIIIPVGMLSAALAFYPVNNRPFSVFLESAYRYFSGSRLYLWRRHGDFSSPQHDRNTGSAVYEGQGGSPYSAPQGGGKLSNLSRQLELNALEK